MRRLTGKGATRGIHRAQGVEDVVKETAVIGVGGNLAWSSLSATMSFRAWASAKPQGARACWRSAFPTRRSPATSPIAAVLCHRPASGHAPLRAASEFPPRTALLLGARSLRSDRRHGQAHPARTLQYASPRVVSPCRVASLTAPRLQVLSRPSCFVVRRFALHFHHRSQWFGQVQFVSRLQNHLSGHTDS